MAAALSALVGLGSVAAAGVEELGAANGWTIDREGREVEPQADWKLTRVRVTTATGFDFSTGDYGTDAETAVWFVPTSLKLELDSFFVKLMVPYLTVDGDAVIVGGQPEAGIASTGVVDPMLPGPLSGPNPSGDTGSSPGRRAGMGDVELSAGYGYLPSVRALPAMQLSGKVKFATADEDKGLGTGEVDYALKLDLWKKLGRFTPFAAVGYKFIGDPEGINLQNKLLASGGVSVQCGNRLSLGIAYDWAQSAVPGRSASHEITPFASIRVARHLSIDPYSVVGLSSSSLDWGTGIQLRFLWEPTE